MKLPDLRNPDLYVDGIPHHLFTQLRRECPVYFNPEPEDPKHEGFWAITKYEDIVYISKHPELFSSDSERGGYRIFNEEPRHFRRSDHAKKAMISMDPPEHKQYRAAVMPALMRHKVLDLEDGIRVRAKRLLDQFAGFGECDFVQTVASQLPIQMLCELFRIPDERQADLFRWSNAIVAEADPEMRASAAYMAQCWKEIRRYALELWRQRQNHPGDDLISLLVNSRIDGKPMAIGRYLATLVLFIVAGNETTRNLISGGLLALAEHPKQRQLLLDRPDLLPRAVSEIVRWVTPVIHMRRTTTQDTEIRGQHICRGAKVVLWYCSANRDEDVFDHPFEFDITRDGPMHLGFGIGEHFCLGARLAELQLRVLLEELLPRFPDIEPCGPVRRLRSNFIAGIKEMPVRYTTGPCPLDSSA